MANAPPDAAKLREAALNHLARYATTEAGLMTVLARRLDRWARLQAGDGAEPEELVTALRRAKAVIPSVIAKLKEAGLLDDAAVAASRADRLTREGKSRRATLAHLAAKGIAVAEIEDDSEREMAAACIYLRRRRAGPFGDFPDDKILAAMARGGFGQSIARRALRLDRDEAEALIKKLRDGVHR